MSGLIATPPQTPIDTNVSNVNFFPDIDLKDLREEMRLDGTVTDKRLKQAVLYAITSVNRDLSEWREEKQAAGHKKLTAVPCEKVNGESGYLICYRQAVSCWAAAALIERYRGYDATGDGAKKGDAERPNIDELKRDARFAIRDILGISHTTVELI